MPGSEEIAVSVSIGTDGMLKYRNGWNLVGRFSSMSRSSDGQTRTYQVIERLYVGYPQYCHGQNYEVCDGVLDNFSEVNAKK